VSDQLGSVGTTTNGNHPSPDAQPTPAGGQGARPDSTQSVDERLEALMQTIRGWDWRAPVEPDPPSMSEPGVPLASAQISSVPTTDREGPEIAPVTPPPLAAADAQTIIDPTPRHAKGSPLSVEQPAATVPSPVPPPPEAPQDPPTLVAAAPVQESAVVGSHEIPSATRVAPLPTVQPEATVPAAVPAPPEAPQDPPTLIVAAPVQEPVALLGSHEVPSTAEGLQPESAPGVEPLSETSETKSRSRIRVVLLCIAALVVVLLIIGAIRLISDKNQGSGPTDPTPTTAVTRPTTDTSASVAQAPLPIPSAELTQYEQYAQTFNEANITATKSLTGSGAARTPAEVVPVATIYATALNTYSLELAYIKWPASLETAVKADQGQLVILASYLKSIDAVSAAGLDSWLAQMKAQATTTESLDNALRQELDLSKTTSFPT
jgi:hypothetical protein